MHLHLRKNIILNLRKQTCNSQGKSQEGGFFNSETFQQQGCRSRRWGRCLYPTPWTPGPSPGMIAQGDSVVTGRAELQPSRLPVSEDCRCFHIAAQEILIGQKLRGHLSLCILPLTCPLCDRRALQTKQKHLMSAPLLRVLSFLVNHRYPSVRAACLLLAPRSASKGGRVYLK